MNRIVRACGISFCCLAFLYGGSAQAGIAVSALTCEYAANPLAVGTQTPRFSWILDSQERGQKQTAYQVLVADSEEALAQDRGNVWDSGRVDFPKSAHVVFAGTTLQSNRTYFWKVRVWDRDGTASFYSAPARFTMALLSPEDWKAEWIGRGPRVEPRGPSGYFKDPSEEESLDHKVEHDGRSTLLRRDFLVKNAVRSAHVHVCGLGLYELYLNGNKVGKNVLEPGKTHYREQVFYNTFDVTRELQAGKNALGIMLGNGWFNPYKKWWSWRMQWFGSQRALLQLHIDYEDGTSEILCSDERWTSSTGAITQSCIYDGEKYDANLEQPGWATAGFDDAGWGAVNIVEAPGGELVPEAMEPIQVIQEITPAALTNPASGVWVFDMGQNFAGWARLIVQGPKGTVVTLRYAENLGADGLLNVKSMNLAEATDECILKGEGVEVYAPRFSFRGFRYVEVTGFPGTPALNTLTGCVVRSSCETAGSFQCGNDLIDRIHQCTLWSQRSDMVGYPMDCPQRDERLGWMGDAHVSAEEAMHNFHVPLFYRNWLRSVQLDQDPETGDLPYISPRPFEHGETPAWSSAYVLIVWYCYVHYGDEQILADHFDAMKRYVDFLESGAQGNIYPRDRYGDWLSVAYNWKRGDPESTTTGYFFYTADIVARAAQVLGRDEDARHYSQLAQRIKDAYNRRFLDAETHQYDNGSQFANAFPLFLGIVPPETKDAVLRNLVDDIMVKQQGHLTTGILGSKYMMDALTQEDENGVALLLASQTSYPSWGHLVNDRTTLSEHWNQSGSNNHVMFGSVDAWFYRVLGGINAVPSAPGFDEVIIRPYCHPEVAWVKSALHTVKGLLRSDWAIRGDDLCLDVVIPVNATATVYLLATDIRNVTEGDVPVQEADNVRFLRQKGDCAVLMVGSGRYSFVSKGVADILPMPYAATPEIFPEDTFIRLPDTATVTMTCPMSKATIRYTLDGSEPSEDSTPYLKPFVIDKSTPVKARAFQDGYLPSLTRSALFSFVDPDRNGLNYAFYTGSFQALPDFDTLTPAKTGHVFQPGLSEIETPENDYALRFTGHINIPREGEYTFYAVSNDGSQLFIDGKQVVNNDGLHLFEEQKGTIQLTKGLHALTVTYFQEGGGSGLSVLYEGPGIEKQPIPSAELHRK